MKANFELYGFLGDDLELLVPFLEDALAVKFIARSSLWRGDYFSADEKSGENFVLQNNYTEYEDDWQEPEFKDYPTILYANHTQRPEEIRNLISTLPMEIEFKHLQSKQV